jgi:hypothetical protein
MSATPSTTTACVRDSLASAPAKGRSGIVVDQNAWMWAGRISLRRTAWEQIRRHYTPVRGRGLAVSGLQLTAASGLTPENVSG